MAGTRSARLRIGIVVGGRLVAERLIGRGESLTIGPRRGELALAGWDRSLPVLAGARDGWRLLVPDGATARFAVDGRAERIRGPGEVRLDGWVRGKLELPDATVLFQAVEATVAAPVTAPRLRPRVVQDDDALLAGFMPLFAALGLLVVALAPPAPPEQSVHAVIEDYGEWIAVPVAPRPIEARPVDIEPAPAPEAAPEAAHETPRRAPRQPAGEAGDDRLRILDALTRGDPVDGLLGSGTSDEVEAAIANLRGPTASAAATGPRGGPGGSGGGDVAIDLGLIGDPRATASLEDVTVRPLEVILEEPDSPPDSDFDAVRAVVDGNRGQLKWCYEQRAKLVPDLAGRVEVAWMVQNGRVTAAEVLVDGTGDPELGRCLVERVRRWRFPHTVAGEVVWPFLFRPAD